MKPSIEQWQALYEAAAAFKRAQCWNYLSNSHVVGVKNPWTGEIGYCCVMGGGGELYGMAVYLGSEGYSILTDMLAGVGSDPMFAQHCLMLSFDSRDELHPDEYKRIKELGLKFRGAQAWPTFRLYEPGFMPWPIETTEQARYLTLVIEQVMDLVDAYKNNMDELIVGERDEVLTRIPTGTYPNLTWSEEWIMPEPTGSSKEIISVTVDELWIAKTKKTLKGVTGVWEIDCPFVPMPIKEDGKPYYPMAGLIVDQQTGQVLQFGLSKKTDAYIGVADKLLSLIDQFQVVPSQVWLADRELFFYLGHLLSNFGIEAILTDELPTLEEAREGIFRHLGVY
ncbi:hypothetical protein FHS18_003544 [Paenibacillus phyllosphaerae]|uniref:Uncharacterized protein n=1 Tax=Paenibacillus phyllosphaerae TaxID=274593 RepID=A0A7W5FNL9_9BACL|nr:hypothetical protein [Paenibacillus phyllosphaerae]MBB3111476.1 hypothetical protein [Paenibacillus phyllosphaerae]